LLVGIPDPCVSAPHQTARQVAIRDKQQSGGQFIGFGRGDGHFNSPVIAGHSYAVPRCQTKAFHVRRRHLKGIDFALVRFAELAFADTASLLAGAARNENERVRAMARGE